MNPECRRIRPLVSAYFDGETTTSETQQMQRHLAGCPDCQAALNEYRQMRLQFSQLPHLAAPLELRRAVLSQVQAVRTGTVQQRGLSPFVQFGAIAAALLIFGIAVALIITLVNGNNLTEYSVADNIITSNQPIDLQEVKRNIKITDANGRAIEPTVVQISQKKVEIQIAPEQNSAPDKPVSVTLRKGSQSQQFTVMPPPPTVTATRPATATATRPATATSTVSATTSPPQTTNPGAVNTTPSVKTTAPATVTAIPIVTTTVAVTATATITTTARPSLSPTATTASSPTVTATITLTATASVTTPVATTPPGTTPAFTTPPATTATGGTTVTAPTGQTTTAATSPPPATTARPGTTIASPITTAAATTKPAFGSDLGD